MRLSKKFAKIYPGSSFFSSNEYETGLILSKRVFNFKMSHIGQFIAILLFWIIFVGYRAELVLGQSGYLRNKHRIDENDHF